MLSAEAGYIYYALEGTDADTQEVFLTLGLDTFLSPSLTVYKDIDAYPSWSFWVFLMLSKSRKRSPWNFRDRSVTC